MSTPTDLNDALRVLRERYQKDLPAKLAEIEKLLDALRDPTNASPETVSVFHRQVHGLTGSGATFGMSALSSAARELEATVKQALQQSTSTWPEEILDTIVAQWGAVKQAATQPDIAVLKKFENSGDAIERVLAVKKERGHILLVEDDLEQADNLALQLGHYGYAVKVLHDTALLNAAVAEMAPMAIIMDVVFPEGNMAGPQAIKGLSDEVKTSVPVIFLSSRADIFPRLSATRAGAVAYLTKPVDIGVLVDKLDSLTSDISPDPFRVLIVDDSPSLAGYYAMTLQSAGMETVVVNDPLKTLDALHDFTPELILMDMYMPGCSGLEMAKVIRQQEAYVSTPIVFLSAETDIEKQLEALQFGADDFLTKPIQPAHLISSVTSRVQRYRVLRTFMVRDSLTGLLNHTKIKEELELEIMRATRQSNTFIFAMIDIDFFKKVNDNYGHPVGDRVIKSLSRLLQQRLRKTDIIGRYGGEEFAVVLKDTDEKNAFIALDNIRKAFEQIVQHAENGEFSVTVSCGLAAFPRFSSAAELNNAADRALYAAKGGGRNCVVIAK